MARVDVDPIVAAYFRLLSERVGSGNSSSARRRGVRTSERREQKFLLQSVPSFIHSCIDPFIHSCAPLVHSR